ncbi:MAG TPA: NAD(P)-dependent oxidoreductase [Ferrovibrio sp.]|uniref:NAD(P)-dependent oxidoreductase n=1 Tax=Ferrovibrio sp. TaxID=1917215 RepID=UPI002B4AE088|nr:NAD(P)-dependent oxidoreductase [Ferrovibrio sp.]HLT79123.1 NAD(P)-dependent oxidoreductase [Ferrovibrio sp.]
MQTFPSFLKLSGRPVLVVGGGENAARKIRLLLKAHAAVTLLAPEPNSELAGLAGQGRIAHRTGFFSPALLDGMCLVISAAGDPLDTQVAEAARARGILVNVVDRPDLSDFFVPAIVERGDITVGIASNGTAPLLLGRIRAQIEALLPARLGALAALAGEFRTTVARVMPDAGRRRAFWERVFDGPVAARALAGEQAAARSALLAELNGPQPDAAQGIVHVVDAGPGDPELLTLAALRALQEADIILHDEGVAPEILDRARRDAERLPVGENGALPAADGGTGALLAEHAASGRRVVRLRAGDPARSIRIGDEIDHLESRGIAVVVVPGVAAEPRAGSRPLRQRRRA